jgi:uncharacterized protein (DUF433 family)
MINWQDMTLDMEKEAPPLRADCGGEIRVGNTRVALASVLAAFCEGATPEEINQRFPSTRLADIYHILAHYLAHRPKMDAFLDEQLRATERTCQNIEKQFPPGGIRARLLARQGK